MAIKVLPASFSRDPQSLARFEREAKALATLNHPHIAGIHGCDADQGTHFLVLELVEGETLGERLRRGPLPVKEALTVARQMAEAIQEAHEKGIIHRDLKPGNVKITPNGRVKVLDFGLAKMEQTFRGEAGSGSPPAADPDAPTMLADTTRPGAVMGTPAYMSPEQARGQEVDKRTDIWAFGCCLYECLSGRKPFRGQTASDLMAEVLKSDPDRIEIHRWLRMWSGQTLFRSQARLQLPHRLPISRDGTHTRVLSSSQSLRAASSVMTRNVQPRPTRTTRRDPPSSSQGITPV